MEKKVVMAEVPLQKEILGAKNNNLQKNTAIEQRSNIFSYFTFTQDHLVFD